ncbi:MAG: hypothetical protein GF317_18110 [Candidatus Lokiarchaeota archaeon]|nr:hypothetical protein [Candidatus Lokiarchaeota archaeon]MBD3201428.1 hypothetical protein [Candidatus Lokiarchaeota archaeon]
MVKKRNLSKKRTDRLTISISPFLKDWLTRYVKEEHKKHPENNKYTSLSRYVSNVIEASLKLLEKGKSLEDLHEIPDQKIQKFYDDLTFRAVIAIYEANIEKNKYDLGDFESLIPLYLQFRDFIIGENVRLDDQKFLQAANRFKSFMFSNRVTKDFNISKKGDKFYVEFGGEYPHIHFMHSKGLAQIFGVLGLRLTDMILTQTHTRMELEKTYAFDKTELLKQKRAELYYYNCKKFTNFCRIINDEEFQLWIKMAEYENSMITFNNYRMGLLVIQEIIDEILEYSQVNYKQNIIKLFEKFNWISMNHMSEKIIIIDILFPIEENELEKKLLLDTLKKHCHIVEIDGNYKVFI